jgi:hypothetical protein
VRQIGSDESFRDVVQSGDRDVACASAQSGQRAFRRHMAKQSLQSFADSRKYHA